MPEREVFEAALDLPREERAAYLRGACAGDAALRERIEALLSKHDQAGSFLEGLPITGEPLPDPAHPDAGHGAESVGRVLAGRYELLEVIGEGGMGTVWMARQTEPVKRPVAVKLIKAGMGSRLVLARFEAERQALALMDHPNIARVLDAGDAGGLPFFVMELVKGVPITRFCDEHRLTPRQRLELFVPVCHAVQHAHQKGIIHRDLKPSNVLVALYDDRPVPKVIDFGVAKAAGQRLTRETLQTGLGAVVGTLEYMSPEQAGFNQLDVDTRSDVYSLGVLLYELLTGTPPFGRKELEKAGVLEMLRLIREQEPPRPSAKLGTADGLPTLAANRGTDPGRLVALVRGELDWIVMKALEKDRDRRYDSANAFALDVQRHLADEAVQACPPSVSYRFRKFARRHKVGLAMTGLAAVLLVASAGSLVWSWRHSLEAQALIERARDREREERIKAQAALAVKSVLLAREAWSGDQFEEARRLLEECPPTFRERQWHYLHRVCSACVLNLNAADGNILKVAWGPEGRIATATSVKNRQKSPQQRSLRVWDAATGQSVMTLPGNEWDITALAFTSDGRRLVSASNNSIPTILKGGRGARLDLKVWDLASGREVRSYDSAIANFRSSLSRDGRVFAYPGAKSEIKFIEVSTGQELSTLRSPSLVDPVLARGMVLSGDGQLLALWRGTLPQGTRFHLQQPARGEDRTFSTIDEAGTVAFMTFSPDNKRFAGVFTPGQGPRWTVRVWNVANAEKAVTFQTHTQKVTCGTFSPNGKYFATGSEDRTVILWDVTTGKEALTFRGHTAAINSVEFSPDGQRLASGGWDGTVRIWEVRPLDDP